MILYLLLIQFLIATAFIANKLIVLSISPDFFVFLRMGISGLLLFIIFCINKQTLISFKNNFYKILNISIFTTFLPSLLKAYALSNITSSRAAFWGTLEPFITASYLYFLYNQKLSYKQFLGCLIGFIGSIFFIITSNGQELISAKICLIADIAQILNIILSRFGWLKAQEIIKKNIFLPEQINAFSSILSALMCLFVNTLRNKGFSSFYINFDFKLIILFFYTIIIGNMLAYSMYGYALKKYNATIVSLSALSMPLFVHLLGPFVFKEKIYFSFFVSMAFIFFGIYIFNKKNKIKIN